MPRRLPRRVYKRVLLKLSGEALMGDQALRHRSRRRRRRSPREVGEVQRLGVETAVVIGGGNIFRGLAGERAGHGPRHGRLHGHAGHGHQRPRAAGRARARRASSTRVLTAIEMRAVAEPFIRRRAIRHLEKGRVVVFAAGTGNPYFTTDTAAALRAMEIKADVILKGTKVDGIYSADPVTHPEATRFDTICLPQGARAGPAGDGRHRDLALHGQPPADRRLQPADAGQPEARDRAASRSGRWSTA